MKDKVTQRWSLLNSSHQHNKNLANANRSRVSCAYNTSKASIGIITRDIEMYVKGHSRSVKLVPFERLGAVSYSPSIVTMAVSVAVCEIFSIKEWCDLENKVRVRSRSLEMAPFGRSHTSSYQCSIVTMTYLVSFARYNDLLVENR